MNTPTNSKAKETYTTLPEYLTGTEVKRSDLATQRVSTSVKANTASVPESDISRARLILEIISSDNFLILVDEGKITFAMIKPHTNEAVSQTGTDDEVADRVYSDIQNSPLTPILKLPIVITRDMAESFYGHLKGKYDDDGTSVLDRVAGFMSSGPATALILFSEEPNTIPEWRKQMGPTRLGPDAEGRTDRIRHKYRTARGENNTVHGSDSPENVKIELEFLKEAIKTTYNV